MMTDAMKAKLKHLVVEHEGYSKVLYSDSVGKMSIGIGYNISDRGMTDKWINDQYAADVDYFYTCICHDYPWFKSLDEARQIALLDMCFMGFKKFCGFKLMLDALEREDYKTAAFELLHSNWAIQVKNRATQLADIILTGSIEAK